MKEEFRDIELVNNTDRHCFEMKVGENLAIIKYKQNQNKMILIHTEVPASLEGTGAPTAIVEKALAYLEKNHFSIIPQCPFVIAYIKRHPEWNRIVDTSMKNI